MNYYIFKTSKNTGRTVHICNGSHNDERECRIYWQSYMYGFIDGAFEILGASNVQIIRGEHKLSFEIYIKTDGKCVEYFMLFDKDGQDLISDICKTPTP